MLVYCPVYHLFHIFNPRNYLQKETICLFSLIWYDTFAFLQAITQEDLSLHTRISMNMSQLQSLDSERVGGYGWVGVLMISELWKWVFSLREALELTPYNASTYLDEVYWCSPVSQK